MSGKPVLKCGDVMFRFAIGLIGIILVSGADDSVSLWYLICFGLISLGIMSWPVLDGTLGDE